MLPRLEDVALPAVEEALDQPDHGIPKRCATQGNASAMAADQK